MRSEELRSRLIFRGGSLGRSAGEMVDEAWFTWLRNGVRVNWLILLLVSCHIVRFLSMEVVQTSFYELIVTFTGMVLRRIG